MEEQISRHYGINASTSRGLPDELTGRLAAVAAESATSATADKSTRERSATVAAIAYTDRVDAARGAERVCADKQLRQAAEFDAALAWAKIAVPRDAERYVYAGGERKDAARENITTGWEVVQSKAWAIEHAPALAAQFAQTEISATRQDYLAARTELIHEWSAVGRPRGDAALGTHPVAASESSAPPHRYDSTEGRDALTTQLRAAGIDPDAIEARLAADRDNAHPIGTPAASTSASPKASKGDRSNARSASTERGDR